MQSRAHSVQRRFQCPPCPADAMKMGPKWDQNFGKQGEHPTTTDVKLVGEALHLWWIVFEHFLNGPFLPAEAAGLRRNKH
jgi:hypothetical protein